ncbi:MAG: T9SS type A sorting domain-containing protein, partial [Bacteroidetes bacterium]|nr:T9SS type A sorting domain-containing protein [Bacteroidota bacterium]
ASVKELLALKRIYDHDFTGLKSYLDSVPTLQQDTETMNLTAHVSNWCNIENEDYITAINWFESQIENPPSFEDSIFAIIDLSYTYTLMESGGSRSSSYVGRYPEYKFATRKAYEKNREYLIDLLFKISGNQSDDQFPINNDTTVFSLIQNFPNPFRDQTDIIFSIPTAARVSIKVYNVLGALVEVPYDEFVESGEHRFTLSTKNLSEGIYYYSLEVNNEKKDVKKMILLR